MTSPASPEQHMVAQYLLLTYDLRERANRLEAECDQLRKENQGLRREIERNSAPLYELWVPPPSVEPRPPAVGGTALPWSHWNKGTRLAKGPLRTRIVEIYGWRFPDGTITVEVQILGNTRLFYPSHLYSIGWREETEADKSPEPSGEEPVATGQAPETAPETAPAPEWTLWELDQTIEATDGSRIILTEDNLGEWPRWYRQGFRRKKSPETAPESYDWQVGDEINPGNGDRILVVQHVRDGLVKFCGEACTNTQEDLEKFGCTLYRKASDVPDEPAPEPYQWQVGDIIESNAFTRRRVEEMHCGGVLLEGMGAPLPQPEWERRGFKLHRKASDMPDLPPFTPQQVAEFAAVTEPIDDSTHAPRFSGLNWVRYQPDEHQLREGRQYMAAFRDFDERGNSLPFEFVVVTPHYDEDGILSLDVGDAEVEPTEVLFVALLEDSTGTNGEGQS